MFVLSVIPIARGINKDLLSYFSKEPITEGSVVEIPLRNKKIYGIVLLSRPLQEAKAEIKSADFELKKITGKPRKAFSQSFITAVNKIAHLTASTNGAVLYDLVPKTILTNLDELKPMQESVYVSNVRQDFVLQENDEDRYAHYKSFIREKFAKKRSVLLLMPTSEDIKKARAFLEKGIQEYTFVFHSTLTPKVILESWNKALTANHPILIICTGSFLSIPRHDIGAIIVERENSRGYKNRSRPFLDIRTAAKILAKEIGADFMLGDTCLRIETLFEYKDTNYNEYAPLSFRSLSTAEEAIIDMRAPREDGKKFSVISRELEDLIIKNKENNEHLFIFSARKGVAPSTVCSDCETVVTCKKCKTPLILHGNEENRFFLCNKCGERSLAHVRCAHCDSWRLQPLGIGTELVEYELLNRFPEIEVFRLDKTTVPTHKKAISIIDKFYNAPGSILIGTELALLYMDKKVDTTAVASLDSYLSIPDFRISEKIMSIILKVRTLATKYFLLQTRKKDDPLLESAFKGNIADFYRDEIEMRKMLNFPPFFTLIRVTCSGKHDTVLKSMEQLTEEFKDFEVDVFPAFVSLGKGEVGMHALIRVARKDWPSNRLLNKLSSLPSEYSVNVDPESLL